MRNAVSSTETSPAQALRRFYHLGLRPEGAAGAAGLLPPHLAPLREAAHVRGAFPVCLTGGETPGAVPVSALLDGALRALEADDSRAGRAAKVVRLLEDELTRMAGQDEEEALSGLWGAAATALIANTDLPEHERERIRQDLSRLRKHITVDGPVLPFHPATPVRLLQQAAAQHYGANAPSPAIETVDSGQAASGFVQQRVDAVRGDAADDAAAAAHPAAGPYALVPDEQAAVPPILLHLDTGTLDREAFDEILDVLDSPLPVKVLVTVDRLGDGLPAALGSLNGGRARLAERAMALGHVFVLQAAASQAGLLMEAYGEGLRYGGPALFCVFTGAGTEAALPGYAVAEAALASRAYPAFVFDPSKGDDWATRFRLAGNPQPEARWPQMEKPDADGAANPFTAADFLACDPGLADLFMKAPPAVRNVELTPLEAYLALSQQERGGRLPFLLLADAHGKEHRVICARPVVRTAEAAASRWRSLQELGGIDNAHATRAVASERERLTQAFEAEKATLAQQHAAEIDAVTAALAPKIVSNIAAGLLGLAEAGPDLAVPPSEAVPPEAAPAAAPPKAPAEAKKEPPPAPAAEEEAPLSLDEPYVDTPDCTSCDECINQNANIFAYNEDDKAYIKNPRGGPYRDLVVAAENCPAHVIHPGKPLDPNEPGLDELMKRAEPYL